MTAITIVWSVTSTGIIAPHEQLPSVIERRLNHLQTIIERKHK